MGFSKITFGNIGDTFSRNNAMLGECVTCTYSNELELIDTTYTVKPAQNILTNFLEKNYDGRMRTTLYYKGEDLSFSIDNFSFRYFIIQVPPL